MGMRMWRSLIVGATLLAGLVGSDGARPAQAQPAQKLASAYLVFPFIDTNYGRDTRIEIVNLTGNPIDLQCFYVHGDSCSEIGFLMSLTPYQPIAWTARGGASNPFSGTAAPPFYGTGELKCAVMAARPELEYHNAVQGRAIVYGPDGKTISLGAVGFRRIAPGPYTGTLQLNGSAYAQCPNRLHFQVLTDESLPNELVLVPCDQDHVLQIPAERTVQFLITNEFEQTLSASLSLTCSGIFRLADVPGGPFTRSVLGTDTAQVNARGVQGPLLGLVIDAVNFFGNVGLAGNEPAFAGGRSATVKFPSMHHD